MTAQHDELAEIIESHTMSTSDVTCCSCGAWFNTLAGAIDIQHRDHIADTLIPFIERAKAEALRGAANDYDSPASDSAYLTVESRAWLHYRADEIEKGTN